MHSELGDLVASLDEVPELDALLSDRDVETSVKAGVAGEVLADGDELVRNVVLLLIEKGRGGEIRAVAAEYDALVTAADRVLDVELTTAHELSDADFERIVGDIEKKSGRKVSATRSVEPDLIGGIVLQAGSMRLDASVRGRLDRLRQELASARS